MSFKNCFAGIVLTSLSMIISSCEAKTDLIFSKQNKISTITPSNYLEGKIIEVFGNVQRIIHGGRSFLDSQNEIIKYGLLVNVEKEFYTIEIDIKDSCGSKGSHNAYNLAARLHEDHIIKFPTKYNEKNIFSSSNIGVIDPDDIELLKK